jgi:hypothetical protein
MISGKYFAIIDYRSLCGTLHTRVNDIDTDYIVQLSRNRTDVTITIRTIDDDGVMMSEVTDTYRYHLTCNDDTWPDEVIWFLRGFSGIPSLYEGAHYG